MSDMQDPIYVAGIQKALNEKVNLSLTPDGQFGPLSKGGLAKFQDVYGLKITGIYDDASKELLHDFIIGKYLTMDCIRHAASSLDVSTAHIRTVFALESRGSGFINDGRPKTLLERHHFNTALKKKFPASTMMSFVRNNSDIINAMPGGYKLNAAEYARFERAMAIDKESAIYATSFGIVQIMGFNYKDAGYSSLIAFYEGMIKSEKNQLDAFVTFLKNYRSGICVRALQNNQWDVFAFNYNGPAYKKNDYDVKMANAYAKYSRNINAF